MNGEVSPRAQFDRNAEKYRDDSLFAAGEDLREMVQAVPLNGSERLLDIGTGAGHVAIAFAPQVAECTGVDVAGRMIRIAREYAGKRGVSNVAFSIADVENLPFPEASFDIVTCRFTAHHFSDLDRSVGEIARVLRPGGRLLVVDHYAPEDPALDEFVNTLDRLRDPSHVRESTLSEWRGLLARHSLEYREISKRDLTLDYRSWIERAGTPPEVLPSLTIHMANASSQCRETFRVELDTEGEPVSFCLKVALFEGQKAGSPPR